MSDKIAGRHFIYCYIWQGWSCSCGGNYQGDRPGPPPELEPETPFIPRRGDAVEAWLTARLGQVTSRSQSWWAVRDALADYRFHADTKTPLDQHVSDGGGEDE